MMVLKVTPVRNVLISKRCLKSERADMFFSKVVDERATIDVYDVSDRKQKAVRIHQINQWNHRVIINDKKYFICSIKAG